MLVDNVAALVETAAPQFAGRVQRAADLTELVRKGQLPQAPVSAFILPLGLRPRSEGDAMAGAFVQQVDETVGVLLVVRAAGDATGGKALPTIDSLVDSVIATLAGVAVGDEPGVLRLSRGALISAEAGVVIYQIDFTLQRELRTLQ